MDTSKLGRSFAESIENLISTPTLIEFNEYLDSRPKSFFVRNTDESVERLELNAYEEKLAGLQEAIGDEINRTNTEHTSDLALWARLFDDSHTNEVMS